MIGSRLGRWTIDKPLGQGGMGHVYLVHDTESGQQAAIKVLAPELSAEAGFLERFQREIEVLRTLDHPNIIRFLESGEQNHLYYYVMEYVDGQSFEDLLIRQRKIHWSDALNYALQICPALKHAHDHGIVHRDIKPPNLLCSKEGVVKLADFGIAKVFAGRQITSTGSVVGTAEYLSPEMATGKQATKRSDLYSLGAVLYTLLVGRPPFQGRDAPDIMHKHVYGQFEKPRRIVPDIPIEIEEVVCQLLEKQPDRRPPDAGVLQRQLEQIRGKLDRKAHQTEIGARSEIPTVVDQEALKLAHKTPTEKRRVRKRVRRVEEPSTSESVRQVWVILPLFLLCVGAIVWAFWPRPKPSAEELYQAGAQLMESMEPADWSRAWDEYFVPLQIQYPEHAYRKEVESSKQRIDDQAALQRALTGRETIPPSEAQRFFRRGLRFLQDGDIEEARQVWESVVTAYSGIESEARWVHQAENALQKLQEKGLEKNKNAHPAPEVEEHIRKLREQGKLDEAKRVQQALDKLTPK